MQDPGLVLNVHAWAFEPLVNANGKGWNPMAGRSANAVSNTHRLPNAAMTWQQTSNGNAPQRQTRHDQPDNRGRRHKHHQHHEQIVATDQCRRCHQHQRQDKGEDGSNGRNAVREHMSRIRL
jgi:hypothetical protein